MVQVGFDRDLFSGNPSLSALVEKYDVTMTAEEQARVTNVVWPTAENGRNHNIIPRHPAARGSAHILYELGGGTTHH